MAANVTDNLTPQQEKAIVALLHEPTADKAAARCNVAERTIHRWLEEPVFADAYRRARRECFKQASARIRRLEVSQPPVREGSVDDDLLVQALLRNPVVFSAGEIVVEAWESVPTDRRTGDWWGRVMRRRPEVRAAAETLMAWCRSTDTHR